MEPKEKKAFEPSGLVPRSIVRTFERFRQQLLPGSETAAIREYRISRYQVLVSARCLFTLLTIPIATNWLVSNWLLAPLIEHFWNTQQSEIFLNSYQEERAFAELESFSEKLFFESLLDNKIIYDDINQVENTTINDSFFVFPRGNHNLAILENACINNFTNQKEHYSHIQDITKSIALIKNFQNFTNQSAPFFFKQSYPINLFPFICLIPTHFNENVNNFNSVTYASHVLPSFGSEYQHTKNDMVKRSIVKNATKDKNLFITFDNLDIVNQNLFEMISYENSPFYYGSKPSGLLKESQLFRFGNKDKLVYHTLVIPSEYYIPFSGYRNLSNEDGVCKVGWLGRNVYVASNYPTLPHIYHHHLLTYCGTSQHYLCVPSKMVCIGDGNDGNPCSALPMRTISALPKAFEDEQALPALPSSMQSQRESNACCTFGNAEQALWLPSLPSTMQSQRESNACYLRYAEMVRIVDGNDGNAGNAFEDEQALWLPSSMVRIGKQAIPPKVLRSIRECIEDGNDEKAFGNAEMVFQRWSEKDILTSISPLPDTISASDSCNASEAEMVINNIAKDGLKIDIDPEVHFQVENTKNFLGNYGDSIQTRVNPVKNIQKGKVNISLKTKEKVQEKILELAIYYNQQTILSITNIVGDLVSLFTLACLFVWMKPEIAILKSFLIEAIYSLSDTTKSFLLILLTDLLVGFHSPRGWETALELLLKHFGLPENQDFVFLFVATFPVLLDTVFKYWIFRHLNKISPSTVATYHSMIE